VTSRDKALSSVVVEQNGLVEKGADFALLPKDDKLFIGRTLAVQPFKELSYRDFGRPGRDDRSGMLPPKLAQIMINLACPAFAVDTVLFDPYCGSGTVLTEALLLGARQVIGLDISERAIKDSGDNIIWARQKFALAGFSFDLFRDDARQASRHIRPGSVDAIVTEPYLGPQRGAFDMGRVKKELESLYSQSLEDFVRLLKPGGKICMVWPVFSRGNHRNFLAPKLSGLKIARVWPDKIIAKIRPDLSERGLPVYGRPGQKVWREIVVLEKK
jgi:tRNA G10  N-methylase Trm11